MELIVNDELTLRTPKPETDGPRLAAIIAKDRETLQQWLPWVPTNTTASEISFLQELVTQAQQHRSLQLIILWHDEPVGMVGFNRYDQLDSGQQNAEIGYWLANQAVGHGIMHQAVLALCQYGFSDLQLDAITIVVAVLNQRSNHVAQRAGFQLDHVVPNQITLYDGSQVDANYWLKFKPDGQLAQSQAY
ncbi:GNAT family N-acetyltransferase [Fructilactobacillus cliffordii]|uniref:GNAT family N-acetyltransferase n=1 Tax=Fructilactobacillus cliffordii TaxID=2940299 RepID=UPI002093DE20|nr:GNAT family protein [Fructilactobacillus cliffordii]USS86873.1 GNAT family N-acetyltransferase [Fructilactobacillus cliffordii]